MPPGLFLTGRMKPILSLVCLVVSGSMALAVPAAPTELKAKVIPNKLGLHLNEYGLSWKGEGFQSWQVLVASSEARLAAEVGDLWETKNQAKCMHDTFDKNGSGDFMGNPKPSKMHDTFDKNGVGDETEEETLEETKKAGDFWET